MGSYIPVPPIALRDKLIPYQRPMAKSPNLYCSPKNVWPSMTKMGQNRKKLF